MKRLSHYLRELEATTLRNEITRILAELINEADPSEVSQICYLIMGRLAPLYAGVKFNLAEKLMVRVLRQSSDRRLAQIQGDYRRLGDLGEVAALCRQGKKAKKDLSVLEAFDCLGQIAGESGGGSVERKITTLTGLIKNLDETSVKYVVRIILGKLRLGFSDVTLLDSLSWSRTQDKSLRGEIERAYNIYPDIGKIARVFKSRGPAGLAKIKATPGVPIRTAQAERLPTAEKIIEKLGKIAVEPKMDGVRVQCHLDVSRQLSQTGGRRQLETFNLGGAFIKIFSRNLEDTTAMFPDIVAGFQDLAGSAGIKSAIFDGEAIAYNPETEEFLPFQETAQRKRKYGVEQKALEMPLKVFVFDLLYFNGESLLTRPFRTRRELLEKTVGLGNEVVVLSRQTIVSKPQELQRLFDLYISEGLEGVMCKKLDSVYQAGSRNFNWVKYKRATEGGLVDTLDTVVLGYYKGTGRRASFGIGAFLVGIYDEDHDTFPTIAKIGTGLSDDQWRKMRQLCDKIAVKKPDSRCLVDKHLACDVWVAPKLVVEIKADEITQSPVHLAGKGVKLAAEKGRGKAEETGLALRFPRLIKFREKQPEEATSLKEVLELYQMQ